MRLWFAVLLLPLALAAQTNPSNQHGVLLKWTPPTTGTAPTSYNVYRSSTSGGPYVQVGTVGATATPAYQDGCPSPPTTGCTGILDGARWFYVVTSVSTAAITTLNPKGESANSTELAVTFPTPAAAPQPPTGLTSAQTD